MKDIDKTDRKILRILQKNARIAMTELAEKVGLSTTPVTERVRRLERDTIITGYHAHVNPHAVGLSLLVFVEIKLRSKSGNIFEDFRREVAKIPQIMECHLVSGEYDYFRWAVLTGYSMLLYFSFVDLAHIEKCVHFFACWLCIFSE